MLNLFILTIGAFYLFYFYLFVLNSGISDLLYFNLFSGKQSGKVQNL
jgi:hypothetical protein